MKKLINRFRRCWVCNCGCGKCPASHCGVASRGCVWVDSV